MTDTTVVTLPELDPVPFLGPGPAPTTVPSSEWLRSPNCPNTASDCRISVTRQAVSNPIPGAVHSGDGVAHPPLTVQSLPHATCSVCSQAWSITRAPPGPTEIPYVPIAPPVVPPHS